MTSCKVRQDFTKGRIIRNVIMKITVIVLIIIEEFFRINVLSTNF